MTPATPTPDGAAPPRRSTFGPRRARRMAAWVLLGIFTWLILRAYRDPALVFELANWKLC